MIMTMRTLSIALSACLSLGLLHSSASAQDAPLISDPAQDQFEFCKQLYREANNTEDPTLRVDAYKRAIPRLIAYVERFPNHENVQAASYYLGECYYHSGSMDEGRRILHGVVSRFLEGRYVALASNRLGYDAVSEKKYDQAAIHFGRVAATATTAQEQFRGRYQEASCFRLAGDVEAAINSYVMVESAQEAPTNYRDSARLKLAQLYLAKKENDKAREKFEALMRPEVENEIRIDATLNVGLLALKKKELETAEQCFNEVLLSDQEKLKPSAQAALMNAKYMAKNYKGVLDIMIQGAYPGAPATEAVKFTIAGRSAYQLESYEEAIHLFSQAERQVPMSAEAFEAGYFRLLCFYNIKGSNIPMQVDAFLEIYQGQHPRHERIHKALLMKAETLFDDEKYREAASAYNQIDSEIIGEAHQADLYYKRGWCLSLSGDHHGSVRDFTSFLARHEDDKRAPDVIAMRGKSFLALGDRVSALKDFDLLIQRFPKDKLAALAWQNSARIRKEDEDYGDMIRRYEALLANFQDLTDDTVANAQYWIGWGNYHIKKYPEAIAALEKAGSMDRENYGLNSGMLVVYSARAMEDKQRLQKEVDTLIESGHQDKIPPTIFRWLGVQCFNAGEMKSSRLYLTNGVSLDDPRSTPQTLWKMLGKACVDTGKYEEALVATANFLDVVEQPFWKAETLLDRAEAYLGLEKLDDAKKSAEEGLELRPKGMVNAELRMILGDIAYNNGDFAGAAAHYVVVVQLFVDDKELRSDALFKSYDALMKKGDSEEAEHYLETLRKEFPDYLDERNPADSDGL